MTAPPAPVRTRLCEFAANYRRECADLECDDSLIEAVDEAIVFLTPLATTTSAGTIPPRDCDAAIAFRKFDAPVSSAGTSPPSAGTGAEDARAEHEAACRAGTLYPDVELVQRAVRSARATHADEGPPTEYSAPRWVAVHQVFACGSTLAHGLCRRFGLDPDEYMPPRATPGEPK